MLRVFSLYFYIVYRVIQKVVHKLKELIEGMKYNNFKFELMIWEVILTQYKAVNIRKYMKENIPIIIIIIIIITIIIIFLSRVRP